ncbi:MAG: ATP-binding protein [Actinomycetota bacterium]|nr:ATP-binding protein [Actinomycetota bacterium]
MRQLLGALFAFSGVIMVAAGISGGLAYQHLLDQRRNLLDRIDPAETLVSRLLGDYVDEETGVRGYALSGQRLFLDPYDAGRSDASVAAEQLAALLAPGSLAGRLLGVVEERARTWTDRYASPSIAAVAATHQPTVPSDSTLIAGKNAFDSLRSAFTTLQNRLAADHQRARAGLGTATDQLLSVILTALVLLLLDGVAVWMALRRVVIRPLAEVAADTRMVTAGDLAHEVRRTGPVEVAELASDIEAMRGRIFAEVARVQTAQESLEAANAELARSNEDLEQFAYVASHDLQEPLRKVASFCQLLEQRYGGQLDERGEQYIAFAVDGAKRMQVLINDLLAFSRIGRTTDKFVPVSLDDCLEAALRNLAGTVESTGASVEPTAALPEVAGDRSLLVALFQNLIGNAIKFHGDEPPVVRVGCRPNPDGAGEWLLSVEDNGIGIEARFEERIFVIFQRLHGRDAYAGTGIGLAMCRKIVEFHGGHIWLDTAFSGGTRFYFTLPVTSLEDPSDGRRSAQPADLARTADA